VKRRTFLTLLGGAAAAWPLAARAQQAAMPVIGFLRSAPFVGAEHLVRAFRQGLNDRGFIEGQNVLIEYRSAEGYPSRLAPLASELVTRQVSVIFCDNIAALAAKAATKSIPIVFAGGGDAVWGARALLVGSGPFLYSNRQIIIDEVSRLALPASYTARQAAEDGGLISYGTSLTDALHQAGNYVGRVLKGEKPADLPVMRSTKFELVLNLKTAKALGLQIPPNVLALADEVIE